MFLRGMRLLPPRAGMTARYILFPYQALQRLANYADDMVLLRLCQPREQWNRYRPIIVALCIREIAALEAKARIIGLSVYRYVMDIRTNLRRAQSVKQSGARHVRARVVDFDGIKVPRRYAVVHAAWGQERQAFKQHVVPIRQVDPASMHFVQPLVSCDRSSAACRSVIR